MKHRTVRITFIIIMSLVLVVGAVWAMAEETAVSPKTTNDTTAILFPDQRQAVAAGVDWVVATHQNDDGGYTSFSGGANVAPSNVSGSLDAIQAIAAAGYNPAVNAPNKMSNPITYLQDNAADVAEFAANGGGSAGKVILGLTAANQDPYDFMGYNFVISLTTQLSPTGQYNTATAYDQSLALQALAVVSETVPTTATQWLKDQQSANGSWMSYGSDSVDSTGMSIMALVAQGEAVSSSTLVSATTYLANAQFSTGGWGSFGSENANSTALALQALSALGEDFYTVGGAWDKNGNTPLSALLGYQNSTGAFQSDFGSGPFDDFYATVQSIPGATGKAYPLPARYEAARQAIACLATLQDETTGGWEQFASNGFNAAGTSRAIQAIDAFGDDPQTWQPGSVDAVTALENLTPAYLAAGRGGRVGVVMQGVVAGGTPFTVTNFAGYNLPISVTNYLSPTGEYDSTAFGPMAHNEAMLGLLAANEMPDSTAVSWLQNAASNGIWGGPDANGSSINVLTQMDEEIPTGAFANLHSTQLPVAGWNPYSTPASVNSTSEVVQGLVQAGDNPFAPAWSVVVSGTIQNAADAVITQQASSGCWLDYFGTTDDPYATTDGILLLMATPMWPESPLYFERHLFLPILMK